jgi:hypothetical protein
LAMGSDEPIQKETRKHLENSRILPDNARRKMI